jgi:hypothetical protein
MTGATAAVKLVYSPSSIVIRVENIGFPFLFMSTVTTPEEDGLETLAQTSVAVKSRGTWNFPAWSTAEMVVTSSVIA